MAKQPTALIILDGFEQSFAGIALNGDNIPRACYSRVKIIEHLTDAMGLDNANEYYEKNIVGACLGDNSPMFIDLG